MLFGFGKKPAVNDDYLLRQKARVVVMQDLTRSVEDLPGTKKESVGDIYEPSDGAGYITEEYWEELKLGYGVGSALDLSLKPVYANIDEQGVPRGMKYSLIVLTKAMLDEFPGLRAMKEEMDRNNTQMAVFHSAFKFGAPANLARIYDDNGSAIVPEEVPSMITEENIVTIDNEDLKLASQMNYMLATSAAAKKYHPELLQLNGELIRSGSTLLDRALQLKNGRRSTRTLQNVKELVSNI
jgi:hypothetical protein